MSLEARLIAWGDNVISLSAVRRRMASARPVEPIASERDRAMARLRENLSAGAILYAVLRWHNPDNDWLITDFYRIDGHNVVNLTAEVAHVLGLHDPDRDVGLKLSRRPGTDPLRHLIDGRLSIALFGESNQVRHQIVA